MNAGLKKALMLLPMLIPALYLIAGGDAFPYPGERAVFSDLAIAHYPAARFIQTSLQEFGRVPYWQPGSLSGAPFWANPLSGVFYPPGWLALTLPLPLGFNIAAGVHLLLGGIGMTAWLRSLGLRGEAALLGGVAFAAMPKVFAHYGAGHLTLVYALTWTPWLLYWGGGWKAGAALALIFLADPRWAVYAGILWVAWRIAYSHNKITEVRTVAGNLILAGLWAAPLAVPLLEFVLQSTRAGLTASEAAVYSLPPARLLGIIAPDFGGFHEWFFYVGGGITCLAVLALLSLRKRPAARFWAWVGALSLLAALGGNFPPAGWLMGLPGLNWMRVPARALFLTDFALIVLAAYGLHNLLAGLAPGEARRGRLALTALTGFAAALATGVSVLSAKPAGSFLWGAGMLILSAAWLGWRLGARERPPAWLAGLLLIVLMDWASTARGAIAFRPAEFVFGEGEALASALVADQGLFRVYSPSYSLPAQTAARRGLQTADGIDPLHLSKYANFMDSASGVPHRGYNVTLPPFASGDPRRDNAEFLPDARLLGLLNVRYVSAEYDLSAEGLQLRSQFGETRLYENVYALPRAWMQPEQAAAGEGATPVEIVTWQPDRILLRARGPGRLVLSEVVYPGWRAWVDGVPAEIEPVAGVLRSVVLGAGEHEVWFVYHPVSVAIGEGAFCASTLLAAGGAWLTRRRRVKGVAQDER